MGTVIVTVDDFRKSLTAANPPAELTLALAGLWWDAKDIATKASGPRGIDKTVF